MLDESKIKSDCKLFFDKYREFFPETIYYKGWLDKVQNPSMLTLKHALKSFGESAGGGFRIAEIGIGAGATTYSLAKLFASTGEIHIFDFESQVMPIKKMINLEGYNNVVPHGNTFKIYDSYNFHLFHILEEKGCGYFDYVYLDGAHTFPHDCLAFFLCDMLLKTGGYIEIDDYAWTLQGHINGSRSLYDKEDDHDPFFHKFAKLAIDGYTEKERGARQIAYIVDTIVPLTGRYHEVVSKRIFKKLSP